MNRARAEFPQFLAHASPTDLGHPTEGTRWTNQQLRFHMLFGYLIVRNLRAIVKAFGRLPTPISRACADALNFRDTDHADGRHLEQLERQAG